MTKFEVLLMLAESLGDDDLQRLEDAALRMVSTKNIHQSLTPGDRIHYSCMHADESDE